jgi:hypothetical protein
MQRMTAANWKILLYDIRTANPQAVKRFETDSEFRQAQTDNIKQMLAFSCQAVKNGALKDPVNVRELDNIRTEITAVQYDRAAHNSDPGLPFSSISAERIAGFYKLMANDTRFEEFLRVKLAILKRGSPDAGDRVVTPEERQQAKDTFAKMSLSESDSKIRRTRPFPGLRERTELQVRLQQAQFLSRIYAESLVDQTKVTDAEVDEYIAAHPEFDTAANS